MYPVISRLETIDHTVVQRMARAISGEWLQDARGVGASRSGERGNRIGWMLLLERPCLADEFRGFSAASEFHGVTGTPLASEIVGSPRLLRRCGGRWFVIVPDVACAAMSLP